MYKIHTYSLCVCVWICVYMYIWIHTHTHIETMSLNMECFNTQERFVRDIPVTGVPSVTPSFLFYLGCPCSTLGTPTWLWVRLRTTETETTTPTGRPFRTREIVSRPGPRFSGFVLSSPDDRVWSLFVVYTLDVFSDDEVEVGSVQGILRENTEWDWSLYVPSFKTLYIKTDPFNCVTFRWCGFTWFPCFYLPYTEDGSSPISRSPHFPFSLYLHIIVVFII